MHGKVDMSGDLPGRLGLVEQLDRRLEVMKGRLHHRLPSCLIVSGHPHILKECC